VPDTDLIVAVDQGSGSTKALLVDRHGAVIRVATSPVGSAYPRPGWVEQSADEIMASVRDAVASVMEGVVPTRVAGVCFSTQRESMVLWDGRTGDPIAPLVSWQDQRTTEICRDIAGTGVAGEVLDLTGLPLDPMFSGPRARWLLDAANATNNQALRLGTVDSWLLARLTGEHLTEPGNASRTQLMNLRTRDWDGRLLDLFGVPRATLPRIVRSTGPFPPIRDLPPLRDGTPVLAVLADSHAALFAHGAWSPGQVKATYGTGSSVMGVCTADAKLPAGLCLTIAWEDDEPTYALEGNIRATGATFAWLARAVGQTPATLAEIAHTVPDNGGVHLVPAFNGLGAPWWDPDAQGLITGLTLGTELGHLARAALESIAHQVEDVLDAMVSATGTLPDLLADGGASENPDLMQLQADLGDRHVCASSVAHLSPLGAAYYGGLACGQWTERDLAQRAETGRSYAPAMTDDQRRAARDRWTAALARARAAL
jgi:glycerol kinase